MIEYFTALVIAYTLHGHDIETAVWFESEKHCSRAMENRSADFIYDYLFDLYGNDISMGCYPTDRVSKLVNRKYDQKRRSDMGDEQLSMFQAAQLKWLKQQVDNLQDEKGRRDARPGIERELWAARDELNDYVNQLKAIGIRIHGGR